MKNWDAAFDAFSDASARDYFPSLCWLATMYRDGSRVPRDVDEAKSLFERAASRGHLLAKRNLALMHVRGEFGAGKIPHGLLLFVSLVKDLILLKWKAMDEIEERIV